MKILSVKVLANYQLHITAESGQEGVFDVSSYLQAPAFEKLQDPVEFAKVINGGYFIAWPCGADLSADTVAARWQPSEAIAG